MSDVRKFLLRMPEPMAARATEAAANAGLSLHSLVLNAVESHLDDASMHTQLMAARHEALRWAIRARLAAVPAGHAKLTLADIAESVGLHPSAVSRLMNRSDEVSPELVKRLQSELGVDWSG